MPYPVTLAVPSTERVAKLESIIDYKWKNKDLVTKAVTRRLQQPVDPTFPDDTILSVEEDAPEILLYDKLVAIGHRVFAIEMLRSAYGRDGLQSVFIITGTSFELEYTNKLQAFSIHSPSRFLIMPSCRPTRLSLLLSC
jgi:hypothetical protein